MRTTSPRGSITPSSVAPVAHAAADLLTLVLAPYLFPGAAEQYQRRIQELQTKVQPDIEARIDTLLKIEMPKIAELSRGRGDLFVTVKLALWTQHSDMQGAPSIPVDLIVEEVTLGTRNINETESSHSIGDAARCTEIGHCKKYEIHSFPVPLAIRQDAQQRMQGVDTSTLIRFNKVVESLKSSSSKERLSALLSIYKLAKDDGSLQIPVAQHAMSLLRDSDQKIRGVAALTLRAMNAIEAIPSLRKALAETTDQSAKNAIQKTLAHLEGGQKSAP